MHVRVCACVCACVRKGKMQLISRYSQHCSMVTKTVHDILGDACGSPYIILFSFHNFVIWLHVTEKNVYIMCDAGGVQLYLHLYSKYKRKYYVATFILTPFSNLAQRIPWKG